MISLAEEKKAQKNICPFPECKTKLIAAAAVTVVTVAGVVVLGVYDKVSGDAIIAVLSTVAGVSATLGYHAAKGL